MSDSIINIILNTVKKGGGDKETLTGLKKLSAGFKELTGFNLGAVTAIGAVSMAFNGVKKIMQDVVQTNVEYANTIRTLRDASNESAEEMSRVVQVTDDYKISTEQVLKAQKTLASEGLSLNIDTLARMADEYGKLTTSQEKTNYLNEKLGKSGQAWAGFLSQTGAQIKANAANINEALIVGDQFLTQMRELEIAQDNLNDVEMAFKLKVGPGLISVYTATLTAITDIFEGKKKLTRIGADFANSIFNETKLEGDQDNSVRRLADGYWVWTDAMGVSHRELAKSSEDMEKLTGDVKQVTQYFKDLTKEIIFNHLASKMDAGAQMELARQMGLINFETYNTLNAIDELTTKYDTNGDGVLQLTEKTKEYNAELAAIKGYQDALVDKTIEYTIHINTIEDSNVSTAGLFGNGAHNAYIGKATENRAVGGPVYAGHPYIVGEEGPEPFIPAVNGTIIPHDQAFGNNITINVNGAGDPKAVAREIYRMINMQSMGRK